MRDKDRIQRILDKLALVWKKVPDYRFYQVLNAIGYDTHQDWFYLEDDEFEKQLDEILAGKEN